MLQTQRPIHLIALASLLWAACACEVTEKTPPAATRPAPPVATPPADRPTTLVEDIQQARATARELADAAYKAEEPLWRQAVGVSKPSQVAKRANVEKAFLEKELRKVADRRGVSFEDVAAAAAALPDTR